MGSGVEVVLRGKVRERRSMSTSVNKFVVRSHGQLNELHRQLISRPGDEEEILHNELRKWLAKRYDWHRNLWGWGHVRNLATNLTLSNKEQIITSFTIKSYIDNVFKNKLEECFAEIQKQQKNITRSKKKLKQTGECMDQTWQDSDLFTSNGCVYALALMLFKKIEE